MKYLKSILIIFGICLLLAGCKEKCEHQYQSQVTKDASCTAEGEMTFSCTLCQDSYTEAIPTLAHQFSDPVITKEPTCAEEGIESGTCTVCGQASSQPIEKLPHTLTNVSKITVAANCTVAGQGVGDCTVCGTKAVPGTIPINDTHDWEETVQWKPTCKRLGRNLRACKLCKFSETYDVPATEHVFEPTRYISTPGCEREGIAIKTCPGCGLETKGSVPATGHTWTGTTCKTCTTCGNCDPTSSHTYEITDQQAGSDKMAGFDTMKCTGCGHTKSVYYAGQYTFDLEKIEGEIVQYAKSVGFHACVETITPSSLLTISTYRDDKYELSVHNGADYDKSPDLLIQKAKEYIDAMHKALSRPSEVTVIVDLSYQQNKIKADSNIWLRVSFS